MTCSLYYFWEFKFDIKCITNFLRNYQSWKKCVSRWGLQVMFVTFCEILHVGWDKRKLPWFLWFLLWFHHENRLDCNFHHYIRNQHIKIRKYREFNGNRNIHLFGTVTLVAFGHFLLLKISFFSKNNGLGQECIEH